MTTRTLLCLLLAHSSPALALDEASAEPTAEQAQPVDPSPAAVEAPPEAPPEEPARPTFSHPSYESSVLGKRAQQARISGSAHVVGAKTLEQFEHDDIQRVLKSVPGVYVREEDGFGLRPNIGLRGANSDRSSKVTLMEDGVLFGPAPYSAPAAYFFPMTTRMTKVEVFKGPAAIRSGPSTIGGALNLVTRPVPTGLAGGLDASYGSYGTTKAHGHVGYGTERYGVLFEGLRLSSNGFRAIDGGGDSGFEKLETMLKAHWFPVRTEVSTQKLELKVGYSNEDSRETYLGLTDADLRESPWRRYSASAQDRMQWWRSQLQLSHLWTRGDTFELRTVAYRHDMQRTWHRLNAFRDGTDIGEVLRRPEGRNGVYAAILRGTEESLGDEQQLMIADNDRTFVSQGLQSTGRLQFATGPLSHELLFGARVHHDAIVRLHTENGFDMRGGQLAASGGPTLTTADNTGTSTALALHALDEIDWRSFIFSPGLRMELVSTGFEDRLTQRSTPNFTWALLPGLGVAYAPHKSLTLLAGAHRGFSPVSPGQPDGTKPELSVNTEAGVRFNERRLRAEWIGFWNHYENLMGVCTDSAGCTSDQQGVQFNAGEANVAGFEASAGIERPLPMGLKASLDASYTFTHATFANAFVSEFPQFGSVAADDELPYVPKHQASATLGLSHDRFSIAGSLSYVGVMRDRAGQGEISAKDATDAQLVLDAVATARLWDGGQLYLKANNLTDAAFIASRRPFGARAAQPRMLFIGFKQAFGEAG